MRRTKQHWTWDNAGLWLRSIWWFGASWMTLVYWLCLRSCAWSRLATAQNWTGCNYEPSAALHDTRFLGANFREREVARRRLERLQNRLRRMEPTERAAITQWLHQTYPEASRSQS